MEIFVPFYSYSGFFLQSSPMHIHTVRPTRLYSSVPQLETRTPKLFWRGTERVKITRESNLTQDQLSVPHSPGE